MSSWLTKLVSIGGRNADSNFDAIVTIYSCFIHGTVATSCVSVMPAYSQ